MRNRALPLFVLMALVLVVVLAACRPETPLGGPPTPSEAIMVTEPAAENIPPGTTLDLVASPARKITGELEAGASATYTLTIAEGATAEFNLTTEAEGLTFSLTPPDEVTLEAETTAQTTFAGVLPVAGDYKLDITNSGTATAAFIMDLQINLGMESTAP